MIQDSPNRYGWLIRLLHWSMAVLVVLQFGKFADRINDGQNAMSQALAPWHTTIGTLLLVLAAVRIVWAVWQRRKRPRSNGWAPLLASGSHVTLHACLLLVPLTGLLILVGGGYGHEVFGIVLIAEGPETAWARVVGSLHSPLAWLIAALVVGHTAIALHHHFVIRDRTLSRML